MADSSSSESEAERQKKIAQFQELFGCLEAEAVSMLEAFNYNIEEASSAMASIRENMAPPVQESTATKNTSDVIDLTSNHDDDLKRALRLSLQDHKGQSSGISYEDQQLSRAVEESLAESKQTANMMGFTSMSYFTDPLNPHERRRQGDLPVGLKNVGNSCWFNVAIQSLFHIPAFRRLVLEYSSPQPSDVEPNSHHPYFIGFVKELQKLFSLLMYAKTKYVEPSEILKLLQTAGTQQDIAEFIHKFLEWLEEAFSGSGENPQNPIKSLFFGEYLTTGVSEGNNFVNKSTLGAFPLEVRGCATLYESLSAAMYNRTEPSRRSLSHDSIHESWFTHLPPVMILELSRFEYNQENKQVLKINDSLEFERVLYMDRFLLEHREETLKRHEKEVVIRCQLQEDDEMYNKLSNYCGKPVSLPEVLSLVKKYATDRVACGEEANISSLESLLDKWKEEAEQSMEDVKRKIDSSKQALTDLYSDHIMRATPYHLHAVCVHQGDASVGHYWLYVNPQTSGLPSLTKGVSTSVSELVEDMDVTPVAVKDPSSQTFVFTNPDDEVSPANGTHQERNATTPRTCETTVNVQEAPLTSVNTASHTKKTMTPGTTPSQPDDEVGEETPSMNVEPTVVPGMQPVTQSTECEEMWYKFNDVNVTTVPWSEVLKESFGHGVNTSAYCFVYVSSEVPVSQEGTEIREHLQPDLDDYVKHYNDSFEEDILNYDSKPKQDLTTPVKTSSTAPDWTEAASAGGHKSAVEMSEMSDRTLSAQLDSLMEDKSQQLLDMSANADCDIRYMSIGIFCLQSGAPSQYCQYLILDYVMRDLHTNNHVELLREAESRKHHLMGYNAEMLVHEEKQWQHLYQRYQQLCLHIVSSEEARQLGVFEESVNQALAAYAINSELTRVKVEVGLEMDAVVSILSVVANAFNDYVLNKFLAETYDVMDICNKLLVPCVQVLSQCSSSLATTTLEAIRKDWCAQVEKAGLPDDILDKFADLIPALVEDYDQNLSWHAELNASIINLPADSVCRRLHEIINGIKTS